MKIEKLPVYMHKDVIIDAMRKNQVIVVESPTGTGKTTQLPKILFDAEFSRQRQIGVTQPRRIAAISVSSFIARQYGAQIPGLVGYKMRFIDETVPETKIVIMTDGILLQELKTDPLLSQYGVIMVDEAHERSLNIDFILGLLKNIIRERDDLKIIVSSATINARIFSEYFDECPVISIESQMYPVDVRYMPPENAHEFDSLLEKISEIITEIEREQREGDVLIFLSGEGQIKECISTLNRMDKEKRMILLPLYSRLSQEEQERVFNEYPGKRKVIVATNIAETSVTIDGIRHVIDPGYAKLNFYNTKNFTSSLVEVPVSRASCNQRKGRSGRTAEGTCYRLYTREEYENRPLFTEEEIYRRDLSEVVLRMAELGIKDFERFDYISNPGYRNIRGAVNVLRLLGAIDENRSLTAIGEMMVKFPIIPRLSRMIVSAIMEYPDVLDEVLIGSAFLNDRAPFLLPHGFELEARKAHHSFRHKLGDFVSYLRIFKAYTKSQKREEFCERYFLDYRGMEEIVNVKRQLGEIAGEMGIPQTGGGSLQHYLASVAHGLIQYVCKRSGKSQYSSLTAYGIKIHPGSVMYRQRPEFIVAGEIVKTSQMYARSVSPLSPELLRMVSYELYTSFVKKKGVPAKKRAAERDFTNRVKIGRGVFDIQLDSKKKKIVLLPLQSIQKAISGIDIEQLQNFKGMKGRVLVENFEILSGMNLHRILQVIPKIREGEKILERWPRGVHFEYERDAYQIVRFIPDLMTPCTKTKNSKKCGFLTLVTDGGGSYWFSSYKDFSHALEESLSSLETLIDESVSALDKKGLEKVNDTYRHLLELLEE
jgi:ATP-dependent helicase HrpA